MQRHKGFACCAVAVISEVSRAVLGTTEVTTNSSFMSEMASRALDAQPFTHTQVALKMHPSRAVSQAFPRSRYDGSNAQGCEKGALAFVRVPQSGAQEPRFCALISGK